MEGKLTLIYMSNSKFAYVYLTDNSGSNWSWKDKIRKFLSKTPEASHFIFDCNLRSIAAASEYGVNMSWTDFAGLNQLLAQLIRDYPDNHIRLVFTSDGAHNATDMKSYNASLRGCLNNHKKALLARQAKKLRFDIVVVKSGNWFPEDFFRGFSFVVQGLLGGEMKVMDLEEAMTKKHFQLFKGMGHEEKKEDVSLQNLAGLCCAREMHPSPELLQQQIEALMDNLRAKVSKQMNEVVSAIMDGSPSVSLYDYVEALCEVLANEDHCLAIQAATGTLRKALQILKGYRPSEQKGTNFRALRDQLLSLMKDIRDFDMGIEFDTKTVVSLVTEMATGGITSLATYVTKVTCIREGNLAIMSMVDFLNLPCEEKASCLASLPHKFCEVPMRPLLCDMYKEAPTQKNYRRILSKLLLTLFTLVETGEISTGMLGQQLELIDYIIHSEAPYDEYDLARYAQDIVSDKNVPPGGEQTFELGDSHAMTLLAYLLLKRNGADHVAIGRMYLKFLTNPRLAGPHACHATEISIPGIINLLDILDGENKVWRPAVDHMQHFLQDVEEKRTSAAQPGGVRKVKQVTIEDAFFALTKFDSVHTFGEFLKTLVNAALKADVDRRALFEITKTVGPKVVRAMLVHNGVDEKEATALSNWMVGGTPQLIRYLCAMPTDADDGELRAALWEGFFYNEEEHPLTRAFSGCLQDAACYAVQVMSDTHRYKQEMDDECLRAFLCRDKESPPSCDERCVTCLLPLLNAPCMPRPGKQTHHHDKKAIPGIMHVYSYIAQIAPDVNIIDLLKAATPLYNEIQPFLRLFSDDDEKKEFCDAADYYVSNFRRLLEGGCQPTVGTISTSVVRRLGKKVVRTFGEIEMQVLCFLLGTVNLPVPVVSLIFQYY